MNTQRSWSARRRGNALYWVVSFLALLGFVALAIDVGQLRAARAELQSATDAAAQAGAAFLDETDEGCARVIPAAVSYGNRNVVQGHSPEIGAADVSFGVYATRTFSPTCTKETDLVRVTRRVDGVVTTFAYAAFGVQELAVAAVSTVRQPTATPATEVSCYLPIAVPRCAVTGDGTFIFRRSSSQDDTAGWAAFSGESANANFFKNQLAGFDCAGGSVVETVNVQNGSVSSAEAVAQDRINHKPRSAGVELAPPDPWPTEIWDRPTDADRLPGSKIQNNSYGAFGIGGPVPFVVVGDANGNGVDDLCDPNAPNFNGTMAITAFGYGMLYDVSAKDIAVMINTEDPFDDDTTGGGGTDPIGMIHRGPTVFVEGI